MRVAVVTDSATNVPPALIDRYGIDVVPMYLKLGEEVLQDGVDLPLDEFYRRLVQEQVPASTSGPSIGDFREAFERALARADAVVCVTVASFVSVTYTSAVNAGNEFPGRVRVVDSKSASMGEGFVAIEAARAAGDGATLDQAVARAQELVDRVQLVATINTFEYLRRSGRVNAVLAYAGTALNIKPVFAFRDGKIEQLGRPRSRRRAIERLLEEVRRGTGGRALHVATVGAACPDEVEALLASIRAELPVEEAYTADFTPVMGAHTGPGVLGVAFWA